MKNRIVLIFLSLLLILTLFVSTGCSRRSDTNPDETEFEDTETEVSESDAPPVLPEYHLVLDTVDYITDEEKEAWRPHLIRRLSHIKGLTEEGLPEGEYPIGAYTAYALFDLNLDGVPELLGGYLNVGSGFHAAYPYGFLDAYDLYTGQKLNTRHFSASPNTTVHYNTEKGTYEIYSVDYESSGFNAEASYSGTFVIDRVEVLYEQFWFPDEDFPSEEDIPIVISTAYLHTSIGTRGYFSEETAEDGSNRFTTVYRDPTYTLDGKSCTYQEYYNELLNFMNTRHSLRDTQMQYVIAFYDSLERPDRILEAAEQFANELLSNSQKYVRPIEREGNTTSEVTP